MNKSRSWGILTVIVLTAWLCPLLFIAGCWTDNEKASSGQVWAWGKNKSGQLGNGSQTNSNTPVRVSGGLTGVVSVAAGFDQSLALKSDGTVWAWGSNKYGQLGNGTNTDSRTPVQVGGRNTLTGVIAVAGGGYCSIALKRDGTVWAWGRNLVSEKGKGSNSGSNVPVQVGGKNPLAGVVAIATTGGHSLVLKNDGTVWAWGLNMFGQLGNGSFVESDVPVQVGGETPLTGVVAIAAGYDNSLALKNDGTVYAWGENSWGQLGNGGKADSNTPVQVGGGTPISDVVAVSCGDGQSLALKSDGTVWAWGTNYYEELGTGNNVSSSLPVQVGGKTPLTQVDAIAGGVGFSLALKSDGTLWAWGRNDYGELGTGDNVRSALPVQVGGKTPLTQVIAIAAYSYTLAVVK